MDHRVDQLSVAHPRTEAPGGQEIRSARHVLHAARHDDVDVACTDHLRGDRNCFEARSADHVDGCRGHLIRDARADRGLARGVLSEPGRKDAAEHDLVDFLAGDLGSLERDAHGLSAELGCGDVFELSAEAAAGVRSALTITASSITAFSEEGIGTDAVDVGLMRDHPRVVDTVAPGCMVGIRSALNLGGRCFSRLQLPAGVAY